MSKPPKRLPIVAAKRVAETYQQRQAILMTWNGDTVHVVTYGKTLLDSRQAAESGNRWKKAMGWPEHLCQSVPARVVRADKRKKHAKETQRSPDT